MMKIILITIVLISLNAVQGIDRDSNLLTSQVTDRKRLSSSKASALQALGVGLDSASKVSVDAKGEAKVLGASIEEECMQVPLSLCLGDGTKMMAADAHGKTLVGWWQFDDIAGYDSSGHGGYTNPVPVPGPARGGNGASAMFDGKSGLTLPHTQAMQSQGMTIAFWMYLLGDSGGAYRYIIRKGDEGTADFTPVIQLHQESRRLHIRVKTEGQEDERMDSIGFIPKRRWTHVGLVLEGEQARLYINGIRDQMLILRGRVRFNNGPFTLGGKGQTGVESYIDDVRVYNEGLEEARMHALAHGALGPVGPDFAKLGCNNMPCTYQKAQQGCPDSYHLCETKELYAGALQVARAQGWFMLNTRVWPNKARVASTQSHETRLAICCQDN